MHDQADELRQLVRQRSHADQTRAPRWLTLFGGKGGVGTSSVGLGIATALALAGRRVLLVDGDFAGPDLAALARVEPRYTICDVLSARRSVHEALEAGPAGMQMLLGPADRRGVECTPSAQERLIKQIRGLGAHADVVVVDAGSAVSRTMRRFWQAADALLLVTTAEPVAVMDTYAGLKQLYTREPNQAIHALVNQCGEEAHGRGVAERFAEACRRFLALSLASLAVLPDDPAWRAPAADAQDAVPNTTAAEKLDAWVEQWLAETSHEAATLQRTSVSPTNTARSTCESAAL